MQWNLRMVAAERGIWKSTDLRRALGEAGLEISAGKMSHLWTSTPISVRLDDLDVICSVLGCVPGDLLVPTEKAAPSAAVAATSAAAAPSIRPARRGRGQRSAPPA